MSAPVTVIPWDRDVLTGLSTYLVERFQGRFDNLVVLFPHRRPRRYLLDKLAADDRLPKPCLLPRIVSIDELFAELAGAVSPRPLRPIQELDRVGLLHCVVRGLGGRLRGPDAALPVEVKDFFPWGLRLAALMEEFFQYGITARDLDYTQDAVSPTAAALLANLGAIQAGYRAALADQGASTPGLARALVAQDIPTALEHLAGRHILACGFHMLTGSEDALLKPLWRSGSAEIIWHTDPLVASTGQTPHWSCQEHVYWLKQWKATAALAADEKRSPLPSWHSRTDQFSLFAPGQAAQTPARRADIRFHQGFDLHSQLMALRRELDASTDPSGYAVVLPDTSMLMPVLHHLPRRDVNVSMGFPLWRSPLYTLIETILRLQDGRTPAGYHWREMIGLLRHPLVKLLRIGEESPLRTAFHDWEAAIRQGEKYLRPEDWTPSDEAPEVAALRTRVVDVCLRAFEDTTTPEAMARALLGLATLLLDPEHGGSRWERFVIDAACLARIIDQVIPELKDSAISREDFPAEAVRAMTREMLKRERVPFEADPLSGLQVLGMLETRLLTFERVFILGATEEFLPGAPSPDPLLPDPLRQLLGLPDQRSRDVAAAHTFYRLIQGAREVGIFTSSGVQPGVLDSKSMPSRYVEQLIWEEEKRQGRLIPPGEAPRSLITMPMRSVPSARPGVENTRACRTMLLTLLRFRGVSPSLLDSFLACPLAFFYGQLSPLKPLEEVAEDGDPPALGSLIHKVLQDFFQPYQNQFVPAGSLDGDALADLFSERLEQEAFFRQMPAHARLMLRRTGRLRLRDFARNTPACTPREFEKRLSAPLALDAQSFELKGFVDRIDQREIGGEAGLVILDYKTGKPRKPEAGFWDDADVWDTVAARDVESGLAMLPELYKGLKSIQMPLYMHTFWKQTGEHAADAAYVCLGKGGVEAPVFGGMDAEAVREVVENAVPGLAAFILEMMLTAPRFEPSPSAGCAWCAWRQVCGGDSGGA